MSDVFILGAGFSMAVASTMPNLNDLGRFAIHEAMKQGRGWPAPETEFAAFGNDVELLLSYLSQSYPWQTPDETAWNHAYFLSVQQAIAAVVNEKQNEAIQQGVADWLDPLVRHWNAKRCTVITLNYDNLVEYAIQQAGIQTRSEELHQAPVLPALQRRKQLPDREPPPSLHLLKLHGSANWYYSGGTDFPGEQVYHIPAAVLFRGDSAELAQWNRWVEDKTPFIVPPVADKSTFYSNLTLRLTWRAAARALREATRVFCVGYSMPMTDLTVRLLLSTSLPQGKPDFHIVNKCAQADRDDLVDRYHKVLPDWAYMVSNHFVCEKDVVPEWSSRLVNDKILEEVVVAAEASDEQ